MVFERLSIIKGMYFQGCRLLVFLKVVRGPAAAQSRHIYTYTHQRTHSRRQLHVNHAADVSDAIAPSTQSNYFYVFCHNIQNFTVWGIVRQYSGEP